MKEILNEKDIKDKLNEKLIKDFIKDESIFRGFMELYIYCKQSVPEIVCDIRDNLIGVKIDGERLRFYLNKLLNGKWYIKIKEEAKREIFNVKKLDYYKKAIDKTNKTFEKNPTKFKLKTSSTKTDFHSEHIITSSGKIKICLHNLKIKEIDNLLNEIDFLKRKKIKIVNITITQK